MIPRRLIRSVPTETSDEVEGFWKLAVDLHPNWEHVTLRDPIDTGGFPITGGLWADFQPTRRPTCRAGPIGGALAPRRDMARF
jgi:hypothetical protein